MKRLLTVTAVVELSAGMALLCCPSMSSVVLVGALLDLPAALTVARICGGGLLALGVACWSARNDVQSQAARGLVAAMLIYNVITVTVLSYSRLGFEMNGVVLWPAVVVHAMLTIWCVTCLTHRPEASHQAAKISGEKVNGC